MPLSPGSRIGPYQVIAPIGAGGMGEVYRARDTNLNRDVAIKVLPDELATDRERVARFEREAKLLASLNHPNIATIYGLESSALVLELVEGPTLAERIADGPIAIDEAIAIAKQIAEALEAGHEAGVIHRDLKPTNVKVKEDGTVKVLDYGLAKALEDDATGDVDSQLSQSPTLTRQGTQVGVILGTAAYMSPEQAKGKRVDRRADIWSFGAVLFEMVTGKKVATGETVSETLASVIKDEPDWSSLPSELPRHVRALLTRCLTKEPKLRLRDIGEARIALDNAVNDDASLEPGSPSALWQRALPWVSAALGIAAVIALAASMGTRDPARTVTRLGIDIEGPRGDFAISPDGDRVVFESDGVLLVRALNDFSSVPVGGGRAGNEFRPSNVLFSPDGASIVFSVDVDVKRIPAAGGIAIDIVRLPVRPIGLSWDGSDLLAGLGPEGIVRIAAGSGDVTPLVTLEPGEHAAMPQMLLGGDAVIFTLTADTPAADWRESQIVVQSLPAGPREVIVPSGSDARYLPTGHLTYVVDHVWFGVSFDVETRRTVGMPVALIDGVQRREYRGVMQPQARVATSDTGTMVYALPNQLASESRELVLVDRAGIERPLDVPTRNYDGPRISPDGRELVIGATTDRGAEIWLYDLSGELAMRRLTFTGSNRYPVWSPDGERLAFQSDRNGETGIVVRRIDGTGEATQLTTAEDGASHIPESWSSDGLYLSYSSVGDDGASLWLYSMRDARATPFSDVRTRFPLNSRFSPDGRWIAYTLRSTGMEAEIFVQPVPATGASFQISSENGHHPFWSRDGGELFYFGVNGMTLVSTPVTLGTTFTFGNAEPLPGHLPTTTNALSPLDYDVLPDGLSFIWAKPLGPTGPIPLQSTGLRVILNWHDELKRLVPVE